MRTLGLRKAVRLVEWGPATEKFMPSQATRWLQAYLWRHRGRDAGLDIIAPSCKWRKWTGRLLNYDYNIWKGPLEVPSEELRCYCQSLPRKVKFTSSANAAMLDCKHWCHVFTLMRRVLGGCSVRVHAKHAICLCELAIARS